jgi:hypothetical protein
MAGFLPPCPSPPVSASFRLIRRIPKARWEVREKRDETARGGRRRGPQEKISGYLLSAAHRDGRHKAVFFQAFGFTADAPGVLAGALRKHGAEREVAGAEESPFGTRYVVEGIMEAPDGRAPAVRSVWFIGAGEEVPRLVTAYPLGRGKA